VKRRAAAHRRRARARGSQGPRSRSVTGRRRRRPDAPPRRRCSPPASRTTRPRRRGTTRPASPCSSARTQPSLPRSCWSKDVALTRTKSRPAEAPPQPGGNAAVSPETSREEQRTADPQEETPVPACGQLNHDRRQPRRPSPAVRGLRARGPDRARRGGADGRGDPGCSAPARAGGRRLRDSRRRRVATFAEEGSPYNKVQGLGFEGLPDAAALTEVEEAFARRGAATQAEVPALPIPTSSTCSSRGATGSSRSRTSSAGTSGRAPAPSTCPRWRCAAVAPTSWTPGSSGATSSA
jgi:hypothetical protein